MRHGIRLSLEELNVEANLLGLYSHIILASAYHEVTGHAPSWPIGVPHYPILLPILFINTPAYDDHGVIQVLPRKAAVIQCL